MITITIFIFYLGQFHLCSTLSLNLDDPLTFPPPPVAAEGSSRLFQTSEAAAERAHYRSAGRPWVSPGRTVIEQTTLMTTLSSCVCLRFFKQNLLSCCLCCLLAQVTNTLETQRAEQQREKSRHGVIIGCDWPSGRETIRGPIPRASGPKLNWCRHDWIHSNQTRIQYFDQVNWTRGSFPGILGYHF